MKFFQYTSILAGFLLLTSTVNAQRMTKKYHTIRAELTINAPAEKVWEAMVLDYGAIANFSPYIYVSDYINGSVQGQLGAERRCAFNAKETRWTHERIAAIDGETMIMRNIVFDAGRFPLDPDNSQAFYRVVDHGDGTSTASYEFQFRTKPAFIGGLAKGNFAKTLGGTLVGLRHYLETGETVNAANERYEEIKDRYPEPTINK